MSDAVGSLDASGLVEVGDDLTANAEDGVATLARLQADVPDAARAALKTARVTSEDANSVVVFCNASRGDLSPRRK